MRAIALEIRDRATFIPVIAIGMEPGGHEDAAQAQAYFLARCGYIWTNGTPSVMLVYMSGEKLATADPYFWSNRTMSNAHIYITEHWSALKDGDVIDVEFILGEKLHKKVSERFDTGEK